MACHATWCDVCIHICNYCVYTYIDICVCMQICIHYIYIYLCIDMVYTLEMIRDPFLDRTLPVKLSVWCFLSLCFRPSWNPLVMFHDVSWNSNQSQVNCRGKCPILVSPSNWLVVWNIFYFSISWESSSLTNSYFSEGWREAPEIYAKLTCYPIRFSSPWFSQWPMTALNLGPTVCHLISLSDPGLSGSSAGLGRASVDHGEIKTQRSWIKLDWKGKWVFNLAMMSWKLRHGQWHAHLWQ